MSKLIELTDRATGLPVFINPGNIVSCLVAAASGGGTDLKIWHNVDGEGPEVISVEAFETPKRVKAKLSGDRLGPREFVTLFASACLFLLLVAVL